MNCDKYAFDYQKHIVIKGIIGTYYRYYSEYKDNFQGVSKNRCTRCQVEGYESLTVPFYFKDLSTEEVKCTLFRMGFKEIPSKELDVLTKLTKENDEYFCEECQDELLQEEINEINEIEASEKEHSENLENLYEHFTKE